MPEWSSDSDNEKYVGAGCVWLILLLVVVLAVLAVMMYKGR